jgi:hypothetical protein
MVATVQVMRFSTPGVGTRGRIKLDMPGVLPAVAGSFTAGHCQARWSTLVPLGSGTVGRDR